MQRLSLVAPQKGKTMDALQNVMMHYKLTEWEDEHDEALKIFTAAKAKLAALEAVAEAAQRVRKHLPDSVIDDGQRYYQALLSGGEAFDLCHALDALKGAE